MKSHQLNSVESAYDLLKMLGAPDQLVRHAELVCEAAELLIENLRSLSVDFDAEFVRVGSVLHDAGKIVHPEELVSEGDRHEEAGYTLLLQHGVDTRIARCCLAHSRWLSMECSLEELLVALSDKLWRGKRDEALEMTVIERVAEGLRQDRWELFYQLDTCFEAIADSSPQRLRRSRPWNAP